MKKLIYAMAFSCKQTLDRLEDYSKVLNSHIIECVVYIDILPLTLHHWAAEISNWLCAADQIPCKVKLKTHDYVNTLFSEFGTTEKDASTNLFAYRAKNLDKGKYPDFDITPELIHDVYVMYNKIKDVSLPILTSKEQYTTSEWLSLIEPILRSYKK